MTATDIVNNDRSVHSKSDILNHGSYSLVAGGVHVHVHVNDDMTFQMQPRQTHDIAYKRLLSNVVADRLTVTTTQNNNTDHIGNNDNGDDGDDVVYIQSNKTGANMTMSDIGRFHTAGVVDSVLPARIRSPRQRRLHSQDSADRTDDPMQRLNRLRARITGALNQVKGVLRQYNTDVRNESDQYYDNGANDRWQASTEPTLQLVTTAHNQKVGEEEQQQQKQTQHIENEKQSEEQEEKKQQQRDSNGQSQQENGPIQFRFVRIVRRRSIFSEDEDETIVPQATKIATDNDAKENEEYDGQQLSAIDANKGMQAIQELRRPSTHEVSLRESLLQIEVPTNAGKVAGNNEESSPLEIYNATTADPHATVLHDDETSNVYDTLEKKRSVSKNRMGRRATVATVDDPQIIMTSMTTILAPLDSYRRRRPSDSVAVTEHIARASKNSVRDDVGNRIHLMPNVKFITKTARGNGINAITVSNTITTTKATFRANYNNARMKMLAIQLPVPDDRIHRSIETIEIENGKPEMQDCRSNATDESPLDALHPLATSIVTSAAATAAEAIITWCTEAITIATTVVTTTTAIENSTVTDTTTSTVTPVAFALESIQSIDETRAKLNDSQYSQKQQDENSSPPTIKNSTVSEINNDAHESIGTNVIPSTTIAMPELHLKMRPVVMADEDPTPFSEAKDQLVEFIDSGSTATLNDHDDNDDLPRTLDDQRDDGLTVVPLSVSQKKKRKIKKKVIIKRQQSSLSSGDTFFLVSSGDPATASEETLEKPVEYAKVHSDEEQEYEAVMVPTIPLKTCLKTREFQVGDIVMYAERYKKTQVRWKRGTVLERITSISYKLDIDGKEVSAHISYIKKYTDRRVNFGGKEYLEIDYEQLADEEAAERSCSYSIWNMV